MISNRAPWMASKSRVSSVFFSKSTGGFFRHDQRNKAGAMRFNEMVSKMEIAEAGTMRLY